jgi:hypothetical protein
MNKKIDLSLVALKSKPRRRKKKDILTSFETKFRKSNNAA